MADISKFIGDKSAQQEGTWIEFQPGIKFLLVYSEKGKPHQYFLNGFAKLRQKRRGKLPKSSDQQELMTDTLVEHVVKGWEGLDHKVDGEQVPFEYSKSNCRKLLEDSPIIKDFITGAAADGENFGMSLDDDLDAGEAEGTANGDLKSGAAVAS